MRLPLPLNSAATTAFPAIAEYLASFVTESCRFRSPSDVKRFSTHLVNEKEWIDKLATWRYPDEYARGWEMAKAMVAMLSGDRKKMRRIQANNGSMAAGDDEQTSHSVGTVEFAALGRSIQRCRNSTRRYGIHTASFRRNTRTSCRKTLVSGRDIHSNSMPSPTSCIELCHLDAKSEIVELRLGRHYLLGDGVMNTQKDTRVNSDSKKIH